MSVALKYDPLSHHDYVEGEKLSEIKHEYIAGEVYAMSGASHAHVRIVGNLSAALHSYLRGKPCQYFMCDMKLFVDAADAYFYPDVFVTCDAEDLKPSYVKRRPTVIIEVLSPSTASIDKRSKFTHYRSLPSLEEYVLVAQDTRRVERYRRDGPRRWTLEILEEGDDLHLASLDLTLTMDQIYEDVSFEPPAEESEAEASA